MMAYSGWGCLPVVMVAAVLGLFLKLADDGGGDWARACLVCAGVTLVLAGLNYVAALGLNREETPDGPAWTNRHSSSGTPLQGYTPALLGLAAALVAGWTTRWVPWPVAIAGWAVVTAVYHAVPALRRTRVKSLVTARRAVFAGEWGFAFRAGLPGLTDRWTLDSPQSETFVSIAATMNAPRRPTLRTPFAVMSGTHEDSLFTVADAYAAVPHAPSRTWQQRRLTVCAVHLGIAVPHIMLAARPGDDGHDVRVSVDTASPRLAQALVTEQVVAAMLGADLLAWQVQGRDALVILQTPAGHPDPDGYALDVVERLGVVTSWLPDGLDRWTTGPLPALPATIEQR